MLEQDNRFLRFLLDSMAQQMTRSMYIRVNEGSAQQALLAYLRWRCPDHTIRNVGEVAFHINYSRRQLQRVLKELTDQGILVRTGKGCYTLKNI